MTLDGSSTAWTSLNSFPSKQKPCPDHRWRMSGQFIFEYRHKYIGEGVPQVMHSYEYEFKALLAKFCSFNSFHYFRCDLGIWVIVYGACLNSRSLFLPLFTKQVWKSQRQGEVKPFSPMIHSREEELWSSRMYLWLECVPDTGQLPLSLRLLALLGHPRRWTSLVGPFLCFGKKCCYCFGPLCDIVQCSAHL